MVSRTKKLVSLPATSQVWYAKSEEPSCYSPELSAEELARCDTIVP